MSISYWEETEPTSDQLPVDGDRFVDTEAGYIALVDSIDNTQFYTSDDDAVSWVLKSDRVNEIIALFMDHDSGFLYGVEANAATITAFYFDTATGNITNLTTTAISSMDSIVDIYVMAGDVWVQVHRNSGETGYTYRYDGGSGWTQTGGSGRADGNYYKGAVVTGSISGYFNCSNRTSDSYNPGWQTQESGVMENNYRGKTYAGMSTRNKTLDWDGGNNLFYSNNSKVFRWKIIETIQHFNTAHIPYSVDWSMLGERQKLKKYIGTPNTFGFKDKKTYTLNQSTFSLIDDWNLASLLTNNIIAWAGNYIISTSGEVLKRTEKNTSDGLRSADVFYIQGHPTGADVIVNDLLAIGANVPIQINSLQGVMVFRGIVYRRIYNGNFYTLKVRSYDKELEITRFSATYSAKTAKYVIEDILTNHMNHLTYASSIDPDGDFTTTYDVNFDNRTIKDALDTLMDFEDGVWGITPSGIVFAHAIIRSNIITVGKESVLDFESYSLTQYQYTSSPSVPMEGLTIAEMTTAGWVFDTADGETWTKRGSISNHLDVVQGVTSSTLDNYATAKTPSGQNKASGHVGLWVYDNQENEERVYLRDSSDQILVKVRTGYTLAYWDGTTEIAITKDAAYTWSFWSIDFDVATDKYNLTVTQYDTNGVAQRIDTFTDVDFNDNTAGNFDHLLHENQNDFDSSVTWFFGQVEFDWDVGYRRTTAHNPYYLLDMIEDGYTFECSYAGYIKDLASKSDAFDNHLGVLHIYQFNQSGQDQKVFLPVFDEINGSFECYLYSGDAAEDVTLTVSGASSVAIRFRIQNDYLQYYLTGTGWQNIQAAYDDTWYYIYLHFESGSGGYEGLTTDTFSIYVDNILVVDTKAFENNQTSLTEIKFVSLGGTSAFNWYLDALGGTMYGTKLIGTNTYQIDEKSGFVASVPSVTEVISKINTVHLYGAYVSGVRIENNIAGGRGVDTADVAANGVIEWVDHYPHIRTQTMIDDLSDAILARTGFADNPKYIKVTVTKLDFLQCAYLIRFAFINYPGMETPSMYYILSNTYDVVNDVSKLNLSTGLLQEGLEYTVDIHKTSDADEQQLDIVAISVVGGGTDSDAYHDNVANEITTTPAKTTPVAADEFVMEDSAASFVKKAVTFANFKTALNLFLNLIEDTTPQLGGPLDLNSKGITEEYTAAVSLVAGDLCYINTSGKMAKAQANAESTCKTLLGMCLDTISADSTGTFLLWGKWTTTGLTIGNYYVSDTTAGGIITPAPSTVGDIIRLIGTAISTTVLWFKPSEDYIEYV